MNDKDRVSYTVAEAAAAVGCSRDVIRGAINAGFLERRFLRGTRKQVIPAAALKRYVDESPMDDPASA